MFLVCLSTGGPGPVAGPVLRSGGGQGRGWARARGQGLGQAGVDFIFWDFFWHWKSTRK